MAEGGLSVQRHVYMVTVMTPEEARRLRQQWKAAGQPPCEHTTLRLERTVGGYFTGNYICVRCGQVVLRRPAVS